MSRRRRIEEWEQNHINSLTLKMIFMATIGTLAATAIAFILRKAGFTEIHPELLFIPWGIALVLGISTSFHRGVMAERHRAKTEDEGDEK